MHVEGQKITVLCHICNGSVEAVGGIHDVPFSDGIGVARGILAFAFGECGGVCAVPPQSTPAIRAARAAAPAEAATN